MTSPSLRRGPRSQRGRLAVASGVALLAGALAVPAAHAAPAEATATPSAERLHDDFNGDGFPDLAIGAPDSTVGTQAEAGAISVLYGASSGLSTSRKQVLTWADRPASPVRARYGSALHSADLDRDGYADLLSRVEGAPGSAYGGEALVVNWGGPRGLTAAPTVLRDVPADFVGRYTTGDFDGDRNPDIVTEGNGEPGSVGDGTVLRGPFTRDGANAAEASFPFVPGDPYHFSEGFAAGDVTGDGIADLAVNIHSIDGDSGTGAIALLAGGPSGFTHKGVLKDAQGRIVRGDDMEIGDLNRDGYGEIVVGHFVDGTDYDVDLPVKGGALIVTYGGPNGVSTTRKPVYLNQDTPGVPGVGEWRDGMGTALSIADTDGDGYQDVVTGLPGEDFDGLTDAGSVLVLRGSANGLTGTGAKVFSQNTAGVPGTAEKGDRFGAETALSDPDRNKRHSLVAAAPAENAGNGSVWHVPATSTGITASGSLTFGGATLGAPSAGARFGASLAE
ncbi:FG-GAP-like repeat-containing protein [Streptomyces sp. JB150]|uniref:integrin alpha n=1 Tax=Streptomyces sp. JB150 TaxID=2714844 RepID=UPI0014098845|nr:FG-GAP-like repeat-containing protein [Streptomyces sp. JB150]QIJ62637.1 VCBS repeat-containing protein [Streptomyces sp. JB150]